MLLGIVGSTVELFLPVRSVLELEEEALRGTLAFVEVEQVELGAAFGLGEVTRDVDDPGLDLVRTIDSWVRRVKMYICR